MKRIQLGKSDLQAPNIALGCMGMWKLSVKEAEKVINVNMTNDVGINRDDSVLDYCRLNNITVQAWSPFRYGQFEGFFIDNEKFPELNAKLQEVGDKYGVDKSVDTGRMVRYLSFGRSSIAIIRNKKIITKNGR